MGLLVRELALRDFRSFDDRDVALGDAVTVLCGPNAVGKTNTVEALQMLTAGYSFRKPTPAQLVREGCDQARICARLEGDGRVIDLACDIAPGKRRFTRNGKKVQAADMPRTLMSVLFCPDDLGLVKRGASHRRDELDDFGREANVGYSKVLGAYQRTVEQRNRLLKEECPDQALLDAWDASMAYGGATLLQARLRLFQRLVEQMREVYGHIAGGEELGCRYVSTLGDDVEGLSRDELTERFLARLGEARHDDLRRQQTTVGPHRDDVEFTVGGRDARAYGSQGQQRTVALALKMAEVLVSRDILGDQPLLLLDDVMSELDATRRDAVVDFVASGIQTVITTTNLGYFSPELLDGARVVEYGPR